MERSERWQMTPEAAEWMTAAEAADYLKVQPRTILSWARSGHLKGFTLSGTRRHVWRFKRSDLDGAMVYPPSVLSEGRKN